MIGMCIPLRCFRKRFVYLSDDKVYPYLNYVTGAHVGENYLRNQFLMVTTEKRIQSCLPGVLDSGCHIPFPCRKGYVGRRSCPEG